MKTIEIKRATEDGLETCSGELFEWEGFQFCLTKVGNEWMAIELSSGASAGDALCVFETKKDLIKGTIERLESKGIRTLTKAIKHFKTKLPEFKYPINQSVK